MSKHAEIQALRDEVAELTGMVSMLSLQLFASGAITQTHFPCVPAPEPVPAPASARIYPLGVATC